jgi:hypothetical protein
MPLVMKRFCTASARSRIRTITKTILKRMTTVMVGFCHSVCCGGLCPNTRNVQSALVSLGHARRDMLASTRSNSASIAHKKIKTKCGRNSSKIGRSKLLTCRNCKNSSSRKFVRMPASTRADILAETCLQGVPRETYSQRHARKECPWRHLAETCSRTAATGSRTVNRHRETDQNANALGREAILYCFSEATDSTITEG